MSYFSDQNNVAGWRFPGIVPWSVFLLVSCWFGSWLSIWADDRLSGHVPEFTLLLLGRPLVTSIFIFVGLAVWSRALQIRLKEAVATGWRWVIGLVFLPTLLNLVIRALHFTTAPWPYVGGRDWLLSFISTGWYPRLLATPGTLLTLLGASWFIGWTVWRWREQKTRGLLWGIGAYVAFFGLLSIPTMLAWLGLEQATSWWGAGAYAVQRGFVALSNQGYWWQSLFDRFPGMVSGEAEGSGQLLLVVLAYLALVGVVFTQYRLRIRAFLLEQRAFITQSFGSRLVFLKAVAWFGVWLGFDQLTKGTFGPMSILALVLALIVSLLLWLFVQGYGRETREERIGLLVGSLLGAWLLGWPVFASAGLALVVYGVGSQIPKSELGVQAMLATLGTFALFWAAIAIGSEKATFDALTSAGVVGFGGFLFAHFFSAELLAQPLGWEGKGRVGAIVQRLGLQRCAMALILLGYVILPLFTGWFMWFALALPAAVIAILLVLGRAEDRERRLWQVATVFLFVSYFFLSVRGFRS